MSALFRPEAAIRGALMITGSSYFTYGAGLVVGAIIARQLGPTEFGQYAYLVWLASVLILATNNGLTTTAIRFVSESLGRNEPEQADAVHGWLLIRQIIVALLIAVLTYVASDKLMPQGWSLGVGLFITMALLAGVVKALYLFQVSLAKGHGRYNVEATCVVITSAINLIGVAVLYFNGAGLLGYAWLFVFVSVSHTFIAAVMLARYKIRPRFITIVPDTLKRMRPHLYWSVLLALVIAFSNKTIETWLLNQTASAAQVGFFVIAATLTRGGVETVSSGLNTVLMPMMAHGYGEGGMDRVKSLLSDALRYFQFLGFVVAGVGYFIAEPSVLLIYGEQYQPAVLAFQVMAVVAGITMTEGVIGALLSTTDNQKLRAAFATVSLATSIIAAIILVPRYGLIGAVVAHGLSRLALLLAGLAMIQFVTKAKLPWTILMRLAVVAIAAAAAGQIVAWLIPDTTGWVLACTVFAVLYVMLARQSGFWLAKDARVVDSVLTRLPSQLGFARRWVQHYFAQAT
jgi:O-antigen/teichoic acid export membrane protein